MEVLVSQVRGTLLSIGKALGGMSGARYPGGDLTCAVTYCEIHLTGNLFPIS